MAVTAACTCGRAWGVEELLDRATGYDPSLGALASTCGGCGAAVTMVPRAGGLELGHTYWAGAMHFEGERTLAARGLVVTSPGGDQLEVRLGERTWPFADRTVGIQWMAVLPNGASAGQTIASLGFDALGVTVTAFERPMYEERPFTPETVLACGDRLLVRGTHAARQKAWARLHDGT